MKYGYAWLISLRLNKQLEQFAVYFKALPDDFSFFFFLQRDKISVKCLRDGSRESQAAAAVV